MSKFENAVKKSLGTKTMKLNDIIEQFGQVITLCGLSYTTYQGEKIPVFNFVEGNGASFWGGNKKFKDLANDLMETFDDDLDAINEEFTHTGIRILVDHTGKTKTGKPFRNVERIGFVDFDLKKAPPEKALLDEGKVPAQIDPETGELFIDKEISDKQVDKNVKQNTPDTPF